MNLRPSLARNVFLEPVSGECRPRQTTARSPTPFQKLANQDRRRKCRLQGNPCRSGMERSRSAPAPDAFRTAGIGRTQGLGIDPGWNAWRVGVMRWVLRMKREANEAEIDAVLAATGTLTRRSATPAVVVHEGPAHDPPMSCRPAGDTARAVCRTAFTNRAKTKRPVAGEFMSKRHGPCSGRPLATPGYGPRTPSRRRAFPAARPPCRLHDNPPRGTARACRCQTPSRGSNGGAAAPHAREHDMRPAAPIP